MYRSRCNHCTFPRAPTDLYPLVHRAHHFNWNMDIWTCTVCSVQTRLLREPLREKYQQTVDVSRSDYSVPFIVRAVSPHGVVFTYD